MATDINMVGNPSVSVCRPHIQQPCLHFTSLVEEALHTLGMLAKSDMDNITERTAQHYTSACVRDEQLEFNTTTSCNMQ